MPSCLKATDLYCAAPMRSFLIARIRVLAQIHSLVPRAGEVAQAMRKSILFLCFLALPAWAQQIQPADLVYQGVIAPPHIPARQGPRFGYGLLGLEYDPTCAGHKDPSPSDGYPGCLAGTSHKQYDMIAMFDIPAPQKVAPGDHGAVPKGSLVVDFFKCTIRADGSDIQSDLAELGGWTPRDIPGVARTEAGEWMCTCGHDWYDVTETDYPSHCWFDFDPTAVNAQGAYGWGRGGDPSFHSQRMAWYLGSIPQGWADSHLNADGEPYCFGGMQRAGGGCRPCSAGPTLYSYPCSRPSVAPPGPLKTAKELLGYPRAYPIDVINKLHPDFSPSSQATGAGWVDDSVLFSARKGGDYWWYGEPDPWADPHAHRNTCRFELGDPERCFLQHGPNLPPGTKDTCSGAKGFHAVLDPDGSGGPQYTASLQFYDATALAEVAAKRRKPSSLLPYASLEGPPGFWNSNCQSPGDLAYDRINRSLFWVEFNKERQIIHVYSVKARNE